MVPSAGFEPTTYRLGGDRSILLSYEGIYRRREDVGDREAGASPERRRNSTLRKAPVSPPRRQACGACARRGTRVGGQRRPGRWVGHKSGRSIEWMQSLVARRYPAALNLLQVYLYLRGRILHGG